MAEFVYIGSAIISISCSFLLLRNYRKNRARILMWVAVAFFFLALNNVYMCFDLILFPNLDLFGSLVRNSLFAISGSVLAFGIVWEMS